MLNPPFKTHGQSDPKSQTEGTSGPTKWTLVQPKTKKLVRAYIYSVITRR